MIKYLSIALLLMTFISIYNLRAQQTATVGKTVNSIALVDPDNSPKAIPFIGSKVIALFYTDPDTKDVNDPLSDALKAKNFSKDKYAGIGIANCKETWIPDAAIRMKARQKEKQFPGSIILLDANRTLAKAWNLGDCNEMGVVIIIGKDAKIKYIKNVKTQEESKAIINTVVKTVQDELAK